MIVEGIFSQCGVVNINNNHNEFCHIVRENVKNPDTVGKADKANS